MKRSTATVIVIGVVVLSLSYYEHKASQINSSNRYNLYELYNFKTHAASQKLNILSESVLHSSLGKKTNLDKLKTFQNTSDSLVNSKRSLWLTSLINLKDVKQNDNNIFFIETSCGTDELTKTNNKNGIVHLNPRQCCAVESVALTNRNRSVYILHTCPLNVITFDRSPEYIKHTLAHPNVHIIYLKVNKYMEGSPVDGLYQNNKIGSSRYPVEHLSDVLRFLTLWKYGGTYMDFDTITTRPLDDLKYNYAGRPTKRLVGNAMMNFRHSGIGHDLMTEILKELNSNFDGSRWAINGPGTITRMILKTCNITHLATEKCSTFNIYPPKYFYPIYYKRYKLLFQPMSAKEMARLFKDSYNIHFWNRVSKTTVVEVGLNQTYGLLADKYCPGVYHKCGKYF